MVSWIPVSVLDQPQRILVYLSPKKYIAKNNSNTWLRFSKRSARCLISTCIWLVFLEVSSYTNEQFMLCSE